MKRLPALALLFLVVSAASPTGEAADAKVEWRRSYDLAMEDALLTRRPVLLTFYTDWCGWCRKLERTTFRDPDFVGMSGSFVALRVNGDRDRRLAVLYRVRGYPTTVLLSRRGEELARVVGYQPPGPFLDEVAAGMARREPVEEVTRAAAERPGDPGAAFALGDVMLALGRRAEAERALARAESLSAGAGGEGDVADDAALDRALAPLFAGDGAAAVPRFEDFLRRYPQSALRDQALFFYGLALAGSGRREEGLARIREAAEITDLEYIRTEAERLARFGRDGEGRG